MRKTISLLLFAASLTLVLSSCLAILSAAVAPQYPEPTARPGISYQGQPEEVFDAVLRSMVLTFPTFCGPCAAWAFTAVDKTAGIINAERGEPDLDALSSRKELVLVTVAPLAEGRTTVSIVATPRDRPDRIIQRIYEALDAEFSRAP